MTLFERIKDNLCGFGVNSNPCTSILNPSSPSWQFDTLSLSRLGLMSIMHLSLCMLFIIWVVTPRSIFWFFCSRLSLSWDLEVMAASWWKVSSRIESSLRDSRIYSFKALSKFCCSKIDCKESFCSFPSSERDLSEFILPMRESWPALIVLKLSMISDLHSRWDAPQRERFRCSSEQPDSKMQSESMIWEIPWPPNLLNDRFKSFKFGQLVMTSITF